MSDDPIKCQSDKAFAERILCGDAAAIQEFYQTLQEPLTATMLARFGADHAQLAVDGVAEVLGECVAEHKNRKGVSRPPRLGTYRGGAPLRSCVSSWCRCRIIDKIRGIKKEVSIHESADPTGEDNKPIQIGAPERKNPEDVVVEQIRLALSAALTSASPEGVVLMRLAFLYRVPQVALARAWQRDKGTISKSIAAALDGIKDQALARLRQWEPDLALEWEDVLAFGEAAGELLWDDVPPAQEEDEEFTATSAG